MIYQLSNRILVDFFKNLLYIKSMNITIPYNGMNNAIKEFNKTAESIAKSNLVNLPENMVNMIQEKNDFKANAEVAKAYNEMLGTIIDIFV